MPHRTANPGFAMARRERIFTAADGGRTVQSPDKDVKPKGTRKVAAKKPVDPAAHIMPAPKGFRRVSHRRIQAALDKFFQNRAKLDA